MKSQWARNTSVGILCLSLLMYMGCGGSDGSSGDRLEGRYIGTAFSSDVDIEFNWQQSGTEVTGTVLFDNTVYQYEGTLSGNQLSGIAQNRTNPTYCKNLSMQGSDVSSDKTEVSGRITVRDQNCDGTGLITGGTGSYSVAKR